MSDFHTRKAARTARFEQDVKGWKLRRCTACNGSGYYDTTDRHGRTPTCGACNGTGKERYKPDSERR